MTNGPNSMGNLTGIHYNVELNVEVSRNEVLTLLELFISIRLFIMSINVLYTNIVPFTINTELLPHFNLFSCNYNVISV